MLPFPTMLPLDRAASTSLSGQIANGLIRAIRQGLLPAGAKLPGSRLLAGQLGVHRKTVLIAYDELTAQGWLVQHPARGTFVSSRLPEVRPRPLPSQPAPGPAMQTGYPIKSRPLLATPVLKVQPMLTFDDGFPDARLAPLDALGRAYRSVLKRGFQQHLLGYSDTNGSLFFREQLARYLRDSRGIAATPAHLFTSRGSVMAIYLLAQVLLEAGDGVVMGQPGYRTAEMIFRNQGARLHPISVDEQGLDLDALEALCRQTAIRLVYLTPHHHYPTTVTLTAERRIRLLQLAEQYDFAILEDDYDYDFHYGSSPILPLASADTAGMVIYIGSFTKSISPAFRVGYLVGPPNLIEALGYMRRIVDRQGDTILEQALAELLAEGEIQKHLKRAQRLYHQRRDTFCQLLRESLPDTLTFSVPEGGMAVWARFDDRINLTDLANECRRLGLSMNDGRFYQPHLPVVHHTRLGFASRRPEELERGVAILTQAVRSLERPK